MASDEDEQHDREAEERSAPSGKIVYAAVMKEGEEELERPSSALFWSGLAAGLSMGFSLITEAALHHRLPSAGWRPLIVKFGYSIGFLIVILGRQQLFTENTLTPILPLLSKPSSHCVRNVLRLWGVVFAANMLGALVVAWAFARTSAFSPEMREAFYEIARTSTQHPWAVTFLKAIFAGWLIALLVWLLPFAETARVGVIVIITYVIGVGEFSHVVAGAVEAFTLAWAGQRGWWDLTWGFLLPTLLGNIAGGVTLVAAINHAQITAGKPGMDA